MKEILVTGASRGIGLAVSKKLINAGHRVYGIARNFSEDMPKEEFISIMSDLSLYDNYPNIIAKIQKYTGRLDAVIHNAGVLTLKSLENTRPRDFENIFRVNVFAVAELTRVLLPLLGKGSHVVNISSVAGLQDFPKIPGLSVYAASKAALISLTESYAAELSDKGIVFNTIAPGGVQTDMFEQAFGIRRASMMPDEIAEFIASFALEGQYKYNGKIIPYTGN